MSRNAGYTLENIVFLALRRHTPYVHYYQTKGGYEVDFVAHPQSGVPCLVQVCERMEDENTRKRELRALNEAMAELGLREGWLVTEDMREEVDVPSGVVHCLPARNFLLPAVPPCM